MKLCGVGKSPFAYLEVFVLLIVRCSSRSEHSNSAVAYLSPLGSLLGKVDANLPTASTVKWQWPSLPSFLERREHRASWHRQEPHTDLDKWGKGNGTSHVIRSEKTLTQQLDMTRIVLVYLVIVAVVIGACVAMIIYGRMHPSRKGNACRRTDRAVERMEELRKERRERREAGEWLESARKETGGSESPRRDRMESGSESPLSHRSEKSEKDTPPSVVPPIEGLPDSTIESIESGRSMPGQGRTPRSARSDGGEWDEFAEAVGRGDYFSIESDDLVEVMGLSGMALLEMDATSGISGLPLLAALPCCAIQAWFLQLVIMYYMARRVTRLTGDGGLDGADEVPKDVPFVIIFAAIYLHFINCMNDLPFAFSILKHVGELHDKASHVCVALTAFLIDGLIIPFTSLIVGAFYLCTSATVSDVILNSCAVAFISNIDNWILALNGKLNDAGAYGQEGDSDNECDEEDAEPTEKVEIKTSNGMKVFIPVNRRLVKGMVWWMCVVPVVPTCFSFAVAYAGLIELKL